MKKLVLAIPLALAPTAAAADCWWPGKDNPADETAETDAEGCTTSANPGGAVAGALAVAGAAALAVGRRRRK